jgi:8-oxo-dGTP diphosphatase
MADRLYERDPQTWLAHLAEGNAQQPRKRVSADAIIRDQAGRLLLVNPNYKPDWDLPGGMAEANEAPIDAVRRELREELGLTLTVQALLCVDWVPPHGPWDAIRISDQELDAFRFCTEAEASDLLRPYVWSRATLALDAMRTGRTHYAHFGAAITDDING